MKDRTTVCVANSKTLRKLATRHAQVKSRVKLLLTALPPFVPGTPLLDKLAGWCLVVPSPAQFEHNQAHPQGGVFVATSGWHRRFGVGRLGQPFVVAFKVSACRFLRGEPRRLAHFFRPTTPLLPISAVCRG
jgi:hypothetical protein